MFWKAIRSCVEISLVRKRLKALYELSNVLQTFVYCVHKTDYARQSGSTRDGAFLENFKLVNYRAFLIFENFWDEQQCNNY